MSNSEDEAIIDELQFQDLNQSEKNEVFSSNMIDHKVVHTTGGKIFQCKACEKRFKQKNNLKRHERIHAGKTPFQCTICYKCFANLSQLQRHESNHIKEKRHFKCNTCNTGFKRADHLKVHELTHKSFKPFQCETCNKSFNRNDTLTRHQKTVHVQQ